MSYRCGALNVAAITDAPITTLRFRYSGALAIEWAGAREYLRANKARCRAYEQNTKKNFDLITRVPDHSKRLSDCRTIYMSFGGALLAGL